MAACANCQKEVPSPAPKFCPFCGKPLAARPPVAAAPPAPQPPPPAPPPPVSQRPVFRSVSSVFVSMTGASPEQLAPLPPKPGPTCTVCDAPVTPGERFCARCGTDANPAAPVDRKQKAEAIAKQTQFLNAFHVKAALQSHNRVVVLNPDGTENMTYQLNAAQCVCGSMNGVVILDDAHVSPTHCVFRFLQGVLSVEDAGSVNGVYIRLRAPVVLRAGDRLRIGKQTLMVDDVKAHALSPPDRQKGDESPVQGGPALAGFRVVEVLEGGGIGDSRVVRAGGMSLGRAAGEWQFPDDEQVSAKHCTLNPQQGGLVLKDLGSRNGTYVRLAQEQELKDGDVLLVGGHSMRVDVRA